MQSEGSSSPADENLAHQRERGDEYERLTISAAAELAGMHAQTLRYYDRLGLVTPERTKGGGRRYSHRDVRDLQEIQRLSQDEGINLAGIKRILEMRRRIGFLERKVEALHNDRVVLLRKVLGMGWQRGLNPGLSSGAGKRTPGTDVELWRPRPRDTMRPF